MVRESIEIRTCLQKAETISYTYLVSHYKQTEEPHTDHPIYQQREYTTDQGSASSMTLTQHTQSEKKNISKRQFLQVLMYLWMWIEYHLLLFSLPLKTSYAGETSDHSTHRQRHGSHLRTEITRI